MNCIVPALRLEEVRAEMVELAMGRCSVDLSNASRRVCPDDNRRDRVWKVFATAKLQYEGYMTDIFRRNTAPDKTADPYRAMLVLGFSQEDLESLEMKVRGTVLVHQEWVRQQGHGGEGPGVGLHPAQEPDRRGRGPQGQNEGPYSWNPLSPTPSALLPPADLAPARSESAGSMSMASQSPLPGFPSWLNPSPPPNNGWSALRRKSTWFYAVPNGISKCCRPQANRPYRWPAVPPIPACWSSNTFDSPNSRSNDLCLMAATSTDLFRRSRLDARTAYGIAISICVLTWAGTTPTGIPLSPD